MQTLRLDEVMARVVAWHNRHPLARRIGLAQVHSVGEVVLPFAARLMLPADAVNPTAPPIGADPPGPPLGTPRTEAPADSAQPAGSLAAGPAASGSTLPSAPWPPHTDAETPRPIAGAARPDRPADAPPDALDLDMSAGAPTTAAAASNLPVPPDVPGLAAARPARLPRLQPLFSRDFLWPLSPWQLAGWVRRHGRTGWVAPADWPRRMVDTEPAQRAAWRKKGWPHPVAVHLLAAAVGVGDRRMRVLIGADGAILGPRAYSRPRLAVAGLLTVMALGAGWTHWAPQRDLPAPVPVAAVVAAPASAASAAVPAAAASRSSSAPEPTAQPVAATASAVTSAKAPVSTPASTPAVESARTAVEAASVAPLGEAGRPAVAAGLAPPATASGAAADHGVPARGREPDAPAVAAGGTVPLALVHIRPQLSDEDKIAARQQAAALRNPRPRATEVEHAAPTTVYAVVSWPSAERNVAMSRLLVIRAAATRLPPSGPTYRSELMPSRGEWRAAWWPFLTLADAERARVLLAGRGLKAEVVAF